MLGSLQLSIAISAAWQLPDINCHSISSAWQLVSTSIPEIFWVPSGIK
jgi:hypothetical protein